MASYYYCYKCEKKYTEKELKEFSKNGKEKKWNSQSAVCGCLYYYVVCLECQPDPFDYVLDESEKAPSLIYKGTRTCDECRALIEPLVRKPPMKEARR
jgi:hypothetical protein